MNNNEIFEQFWKSFEWPEPVEVEYRLYYNKQTGEPLFYSTEDHDHAYIVLSQQQYNKYDHKVFVHNGKLHKKNNEVHTNKLVPGLKGTWTAHSEHIEILVKDNTQGTKWRLKQLM